MNKARIESTNEIVRADTLLELYPNYKELIFVCIDQKCSVRMAPACIKKLDRKKPHFKKYRNREHTETCEYATLSDLYEKAKNGKLNKTEVRKIGYPSVFNLTEDIVGDEEKLPSKARIDDDDEGVTGRGGITKIYEFDSENIKFDRKNRVQGIDRIVDWYLGFPYNRDVEIEINDKKIQYRYFFKRITDDTEPTSLLNDRIFYGIVRLSDANRNIFNKYAGNVFINLLGYKDIDERTGKPHNYSVRIDKNSISKQMLSRLKNKFESLFEGAFRDLSNEVNEPNIHLFVFVYGSLDDKNDTLINVKKHYITFRYDEVRKTMNE